MKKTAYLTTLAIITVACIILGSVYHIGGWVGFGIGTFFDFISFDDDYNDSGSRWDRVTYSENIDTFDKIEIDTSIMNITIQQGDKYYLEYDCVEYMKPSFSVKNGTFKLEQPSKPRGSRNNNKCSMTLTIPSGTELSIADITSDIGNININNTEIRNITIESDVGDIDIKSCIFETSEIEGDVGDVDLNKSNLGKTNIETDTGDIDIIDCEFKDIEVYNDIGNVDLNTSSDISNYDIELSTDLGSIDFNGNKQKRHFYQAASGSSETYRISIETDIGNISIN